MEPVSIEADTHTIHILKQRYILSQELTFHMLRQSSFRGIRTSLGHLGMIQTYSVPDTLFCRTGLLPIQVHIRKGSWSEYKIHVHMKTKESRR